MPNKMSHDRVSFTVPDCRTSARNKRGTISALTKAFNLMYNEAESCLGLRVTCRPSQFARYIIFINESEASNVIRKLEPKLFTPTPKLNLDFSKRDYVPSDDS